MSASGRAPLEAVGATRGRTPRAPPRRARDGELGSARVAAGVGRRTVVGARPRSFLILGVAREPPRRRRLRRGRVAHGRARRRDVRRDRRAARPRVRRARRRPSASAPRFTTSMARPVDLDIDGLRARRRFRDRRRRRRASDATTSARARFAAAGRPSRARSACCARSAGEPRARAAGVRPAAVDWGAASEVRPSDDDAPCAGGDARAATTERAVAPAGAGLDAATRCRRSCAR